MLHILAWIAAWTGPADWFPSPRRLELRSCSRRRDSLRVLLLVAAAWLAICVATRAEVTYTITSYLAGLADLPRDAFKKNPGSWTQVAILIAGGALIVGLHLKDTKDVGRQRSSDTISFCLRGRILALMYLLQVLIA